LITRRRRQIGSCWRKLNQAWQALVLAHLCKGETSAELAAGFGNGIASAATATPAITSPSSSQELPGLI
jgi:hypothetical protein